ncbi:MAG: TonB-dependent receptor [Bacteroidales bacterium]|nr:TonB-dependent receptor [Bacteroidales bacterium]
MDGRLWKIILTNVLILIPIIGWSQNIVISGTISDKKTAKPLEFATVVLEGGQWAVADAKGRFTIKNLQEGKNIITASCLGYVTRKEDIILSKSLEGYKIYLEEDNLAIESAVITAKESTSAATTSRIIDKTALDHVQLMNVADISSLLPGGTTVNAALTTSRIFNLRGESSEDGNNAFTTAVEVDGVRISNNSSFASTTGATVNNIASANVESVEVITGVPSVEYGDMSAGIVKINTKKGRTPYTVTMSTNPKTKQISASKGFSLGERKGVVNASFERTKSVSSQMSPYTGYDRNQLSLTYTNSFDRGIFADSPLQVSAGITGNVGGMNSENDPDAYEGTWYKERDNAIRANAKARLLLGKPWITNLELNASFSLRDRSWKEKDLYSSAASTIVLHGTTEGYFVAQEYDADGTNEAVMISSGQWYNTMGDKDIPMNFKIGAKAGLGRNFGEVRHKFKAGIDFTGDDNLGTGEYSEDLATAPTFRTYDYSAQPAMYNLDAYIEDDVIIPFGKSRLNLVAGLRNDNTFISGSAYGTTSSLSPRFNARYTASRNFSVKGGWGLTVKQPSFAVLYPTPSYYDIMTFTSTSGSSGTYYAAYYTKPRTIEYNQALKWQKGIQSELGVDFRVAGTKVSLTGFYNRTKDAFTVMTDYERFSYNYTSTSAVNGIAIDVDNRVFSVDQSTGIVTVSDKSGTYDDITLAYTTKNSFITRKYAYNLSNPTTRYGLEWVIDFKKIKSLNTTVRLDGTWYAYKSFNSDMQEYYPSNQTSNDGTPFKYVALYYGGASASNGQKTQAIRTNLTVTTRVPKARLIFSLKVEASLLKYSQSLSEREDGSARSYSLSDLSTPLDYTDESIYTAGNYTVTFPDYYYSYDDGTLRDFLTDFKWAYENKGSSSEALDLYADLSKFVISSNYKYTFNSDYISPYFSANVSVTKEIGDIASVSFYANNFLNNLSRVKSSRTGAWYSVYNYIPSFFYGMTLRLKF